MPKKVSQTQLSDIEEYEVQRVKNNEEVSESESGSDELETVPQQESEEDNDDNESEDDEDDENDENEDDEDDGMPIHPHDMFDESDVDIQEILTQFFQNSEGENIPDLMNDLRVAVDNNSKCILKVVKELKTMNALYARKN